MQVRDVMTTEVVSVGPETPAADAGELLTERGFATLPVVDAEGRLLGVVSTADLLRDRLPRNPLLRLPRDDDSTAAPPPTAVHAVMTDRVHTVEPTTAVADVARLLVDARLRSIPVTDRGRIVGIVSRRDVLRTLIRPDEELRADLLRLVEGYTGDRDSWELTVVEGVATIRRIRGAPSVSAEAEENALRALARTVSGVVGVRILAPGASGRQA